MTRARPNQFGESSIVAGPTPRLPRAGHRLPRPARPAGVGRQPRDLRDRHRRSAAARVCSLAAGAASSAEGPLAFSFSDYQIWPTALEVTGAPEVVPVRARAAGEFTVGSQNMLRLFDLVDDPATRATKRPRRRSTPIRLNKLSLQVRNALGAPDVLAVQEVENLVALQDVAARILADDPASSYTAYLLEGNDIGGIDSRLPGARHGAASTRSTQFGKDDTVHVRQPRRPAQRPSAARAARRLRRQRRAPSRSP